MRRWRFEFEDLDLQKKRNLVHEIEEWRAFGINFGREEKTGIIKSYNVSFTFIKEDCDYLRAIVFSRGFSAKIGLNIYLLDSNNGDKELFYTCRLELNKCKIETNSFSCPVYVGDFYSLLDTAWSTEYEILNRIKTPAYWYNGSYYDSLSLPNYDDFDDIYFVGGDYRIERKLKLANNIDLKASDTFMAIELVEQYQDSNFYNTTANEISRVSMSQMFFRSNSRTIAGTIDVNGSYKLALDISNIPAIKDLGDGAVVRGNLTIKEDIYAYSNEPATQMQGAEWAIGDYRLKRTVEETIPRIVVQVIGIVQGNELVFYNESNMSDRIRIQRNYYDMRWIKDNVAWQILYNLSGAGYYLSYYLNFEFDPADSSDFYLLGFKMSDIDVSMSMRLSSYNINQIKNRKIHGIRPNVLFSRLIDKINNKGEYIYDDNGAYVGTTAGRYNVNVDCGVLEQAGADIYLFSDTMAVGGVQEVETSIKTSLDKFLRFCYVALSVKMYCNYDKSANSYNIGFYRLDDFWRNKKILELKKIKNCTLSAYTDIIYSNISVGWNNNEEAILGQNEYVTRNEFATEHKEIDNRVLELQCDYKAGCFDIETIVNTMFNNENTNVNSDNIFVIETYRDNNNNVHNKLYNIYQGNVNIGMNVRFTPMRLLLLHKKEIGCSCHYLTFTLSHRNADIIIENVKENGNVSIADNEQYHQPFLLDVSSAGTLNMLHAIEGNGYGYITCVVGDRKYSGYIAFGADSITINPMNEKESNFSLILKEFL